MVEVKKTIIMSCMPIIMPCIDMPPMLPSMPDMPLDMGIDIEVPEAIDMPLDMVMDMAEVGVADMDMPLMLIVIEEVILILAGESGGRHPEVARKIVYSLPENARIQSRRGRPGY